VLTPDVIEIALPVVPSPNPAITPMSPPLPPTAEPVLIESEPELPSLDVPDRTVTSPLTPSVPAFAVSRVRAPLLVPVPLPLRRRIMPPVELVLVPALSAT
jgi:hypothetical protein